MPKASLSNSSFPFQPISGREDKTIHNFHKDINPKGNIITRIEFETTYYDATYYFCSKI